MRSLLQSHPPKKTPSLLTFRILFTHLKLRRSEENHHLLSSGAKRRQNELRIFFLYTKQNSYSSLCVPAYKARLESEKRKSKEMCEEQNLFWLLLLFHDFYSSCFSFSLAHILAFLLFISFTSSFYFIFISISVSDLFFLFRLLCFILLFLWGSYMNKHSILGMYFVCSVQIVLLSLDVTGMDGCGICLNVML